MRQFLIRFIDFDLIEAETVEDAVQEFKKSHDDEILSVQERKDYGMARHGIDCQCADCRSVRNYLRSKVRSGDVHLVGTEEDKKKIMED